MRSVTLHAIDSMHTVTPFTIVIYEREISTIESTDPEVVKYQKIPNASIVRLTDGRRFFIVEDIEYIQKNMKDSNVN